MNVAGFLEYFSNYGMIFLFIIILLEYLNLPGFPAGIILPVAGMWAASAQENLFVVLTVSVIAGVIGSWALYAVGLYGGDLVLKKYIQKFPKHKNYIDEKMEYLREKGNIGVFVSKLIPMARTIISIPAGVLKLNFKKYTIYSALGILIWNSAFMSAGYFFGDVVIKVLA